MKKATFFIIFTTIALTAFCQGNNRQRNYIYIFDCTQSMKGFNGAPDIWEPTKTFLQKELAKEAKNNPNSRVTILPFQDVVYPPIKVDLKSYNWTDIQNVLDAYTQKVTFTNICDALRSGEQYIDETCENYLILMTDGHDNIGGTANEVARADELAKILEDFCGRFFNTMGFYIQLTNSALLPEKVQHAIDGCSALYAIDATTGIPNFGGVLNNMISINTRELPVDIELGFSNAGKFDALIKAEENDFVDVSLKNNTINNGSFTVQIKSKFGDDLRKLNQSIGNESNIDLVLYSDNVKIENPSIKLNLRSGDIRSLDLACLSQKNLSDSIARIKPFLWVKGNIQDTLRWNLSPNFSKAAEKEDASLKFKVSSLSDIKGCTLLFDGKPLDDSTFILTPRSSGVLELIVPQSKNDGQVKLSITQINSKNIDLLNNRRINNAQFELIGDVTTSTSWTEIIFWIIICSILAFIILWFAFIKRLKYPTFKSGVITINDPYFSTIKVKGARKVIMSAKPQKQNIISKIATGRIVYHTNGAWPYEVELIPSGKNIRFRCPTNKLISDPLPSWTKGETYKILDSDTGKRLITLNVN